MPNPILDAKPVSTEILALIGSVSTEWAWIEMLLAEMLAHFCSADHGSMYVITQSVSAASLTNWLRTLCQIRVNDADKISTLLKLLDDVDDVRAQRNTIIHGTWTGHEGQPGHAYVTTMKWERSEVAKTELWSSTDILDVIHDLQLLQLKLGNLGVILGYFRPKTAENPSLGTPST
jgi:hypothetical protein